MMLSTHFSLEELVASEAATRRGLDNTPPHEVMPNLSRLAEGLELVRAALANHPVHVTSSYRSPRLNQMIGGAKNSRHTLGLAADILCPAFGPPLQVCRAIARSGILIDQLIHEFGKWCHVGFAPDGQAARNELLTIATGSSRGKTAWSKRRVLQMGSGL